MDVSHFAYPSIHWWTPGLLFIFGYLNNVSVNIGVKYPFAIPFSILLVNVKTSVEEKGRQEETRLPRAEVVSIPAEVQGGGMTERLFGVLSWHRALGVLLFCPTPQGTSL